MDSPSVVFDQFWPGIGARAAKVGKTGQAAQSMLEGRGNTGHPSPGNEFAEWLRLHWNSCTNAGSADEVKVL